MADDQLSPKQKKDFEKLVKAVGGALVSGRNQEAVAGQLIKDGWPEEEAREFVKRVDARVKEGALDGSGTGSGIPGWVIWIGLFLLVSFLCWVFEWPF